MTRNSVNRRGINRGFDEDGFDKNFNRAFRWFPVLWVIGLAASLALTAVAIWAVVTLVLHFTS